MNETERRVVLSTWLRWTSLARVVEAANLAGITDPLERYRFVAVRAHGMSGTSLDSFLEFARERLADSTWQPIPDHVPPELVVGERGAALLRSHGLYPTATLASGGPQPSLVEWLEAPAAALQREDETAALRLPPSVDPSVSTD